MTFNEHPRIVAQIVPRAILETLWVELIACYSDPLAQADLIARETIADMERGLVSAKISEHEGRKAAISDMEDVWKSIRSKLAAQASQIGQVDSVDHPRTRLVSSNP